VFYPAHAGAARPAAPARAVRQLDEAHLDRDRLGCIYISGAVEFDDRTGPVRDALVGSVKTWLAAMRRAVVQAKEEATCAPTSTSQLLFEIHGLILGLHYEARFLKNPGSIAAPTRLRQHPQAVRRAGRAPAALPPSPSTKATRILRRSNPCLPTPRPCATCSS
jgi:hypothetical protein